ncbi:SPOR domain-containing protein [Kiloniella sp.]|uniref:SPOR domain-containing protein n=1 Tax=Kiloniella sp. TaxID=1938587 RepID=UPI003B01D7CA
MSSKSSDDLKNFEKVRQSESMRAASDRNVEDISDNYDDFSDDDYWEDEIDLDDDPGASIFKKLVPVGLGLIAVSIVGGGILIMLGDSSPKQNIPDAIPLIEAEATPEKTKPETPGGMVIPHQDKLVLNKEGADTKTVQVEKLLPPPEVPQPPKAEEPKTEEIVSAPAKTEVTETPTAEAVTKKVTEITKEEVAKLSPPPTTVPEATKVEPEVESVLAPKTPEKAPEPTKVVEEVPAPKVVKKVEPTPAPATAPATTKAKPVAGQYILQLASLKSKDGAMTEWKNMQKKLSNLLGDKQPIIEKASITGVGVRYRLQTGPFVDKKSASDFCTKLKSAKRDCLVKKVK